MQGIFQKRNKHHCTKNLETADLVTFNGKLNGKLHFLCSAYRTLLPGQTLIDFMLQLACCNAPHLGEWVEKIQSFRVT